MRPQLSRWASARGASSRDSVFPKLKERAGDSSSMQARRCAVYQGDIGRKQRRDAVLSQRQFGIRTTENRIKTPFSSHPCEGRDPSSFQGMLVSSRMGWVPAFADTSEATDEVNDFFKCF